MPARDARPLDVDVLVIGAGISGIDVAVRLDEQAPDHTWAIIEAREAVGGTWDLFRYPGIRSDSDMYTLAFPFKPWRGEKSIAEGADIRAYLEETVEEFGLADRIHHGQRAVAADWSSADQRWSVQVRTAAGLLTHRARFLYLASGYYSYDRGHVVDFPGAADFPGPVIHPQEWPQDLEVARRRVVVIGSGATAVTLVPALVERGAAQVTMLQRSPSYVAVRPARDRLARALHRVLPPEAAHRVARAKNGTSAVLTYAAARRLPGLAKAMLARDARRRLPQGYAVDRHFAPRYDPWDERVCLVPDGDLFAAISAGRAEIVTDTVERFDATGIRLGSGGHLDADVIVTATGLVLETAGGIRPTVDGVPMAARDRFSYKGLMLSDVPNLLWCIGYANNSWTLRADLSAQWFTRLLRHLSAHSLGVAVPRRSPADPSAAQADPASTLTSGYFQRAAAELPRAGDRAPWRVRQNWLIDAARMRGGRIDDGVLEFHPRRSAAEGSAG